MTKYRWCISPRQYEFANQVVFYFFLYNPMSYTNSTSKGTEPKTLSVYSFSSEQITYKVTEDEYIWMKREVA